MSKQPKNGLYLYLLNLPPDDENRCEYDTITLGKFDSDDEAISYAKENYYAEAGSHISKVVNSGIAVWEKQP